MAKLSEQKSLNQYDSAAKILGASLMITVAMVAVFVGIGFGLQKLSGSDSTISVNGSAEQVVESDQAIWQVNFERSDRDMKRSIELVNGDVERVKKFMIVNGFDSTDLSVGSATTTRNFRVDENFRNTKEIENYTTSASLSVSSDDVYQVKGAYSKINQLIVEGIVLTRYQPAYYFSGFNELKVELLEDATKNARERAQVIADGDDAEVRKLRNANQGVFQVNAYGDKSVSDYGNFDTSSIQKEIVAVVSAEFGVR